jgi:hypothetical protein
MSLWYASQYWRKRASFLHVVVDGGGPHVQRAAEDVGEAEHVVDLVRVIRAARRHDASVRISATSSGVISGSGLAMAKMIGLVAID